MMSSEYRYDAFICYAYEDRDWAKYLVSLLESPPYSLRCCCHDRDFDVGKPVTANIDKHLAASKRFILIITQAFNNSKWCEHERDKILSLSIAEQQRTIIPVILEGIEIPNCINYITYVHASSNFAEKWFDKITKALDIDVILCSVCSPEGVDQEAMTRCPDCKAAFCPDCSRQHARMPILKSHRFAKLTTLPYSRKKEPQSLRKKLAKVEKQLKSLQKDTELRNRSVEARLDALEEGESYGPRPESPRPSSEAISEPTVIGSSGYVQLHNRLVTLPLDYKEWLNSSKPVAEISPVLFSASDDDDEQ